MQSPKPPKMEKESTLGNQENGHRKEGRLEASAALQCPRSKTGKANPSLAPVGLCAPPSHRSAQRRSSAVPSRQFPTSPLRKLNGWREKSSVNQTEQSPATENGRSLMG